MSNNSWSHVRDVIERRRISLQLSLEDLAHVAGVSRTKLNQMGRGVSLDSGAKRIGLCRALRWSDDSIDLLLEGSEPVTWTEELDHAEEQLSRAGYYVEQSGGREEARDYAWWLRRVKELRSRNGLSEPELRPPGVPASDVAARIQLEEALAALGASISSLRDQADEQDRRDAARDQRHDDLRQQLEQLAARVAALETPPTPQGTTRAR